jgi:hypothetical protein
MSTRRQTILATCVAAKKYLIDMGKILSFDAFQKKSGAPKCEFIASVGISIQSESVQSKT